MRAVIDNLGVFWHGFLITLGLVLIASIVSMVIGLVLAVMRVSPVTTVRAAATVYVNLMRNIPAVAHLFFTVFVLPLLGVKLPFFILAVIGITVYFAAYFCEAVRSGINAIAPGQLEATRALGLSFAESVRFVILPQGLRNSVPPLVNTFVALVKASAVAGVFGVLELFGTMLRLINVHDRDVIALMLATAVLYAVITIPAGLAAGALERRVVFNR